MESFSIQKGLAGYVANSMTTLISNQIEDDNRFLQTIDDPSSDFNITTKSIMTVPIFTAEESAKIDAMDLNCPRAVLQLINKAQNKKFTEDDAD